MTTFQELLKEKKNIMIGKKVCPFCSKAKEILKEQGIEYHYISLEEKENAKIIKEAMDEQNYRSFPLVFLDGKFVGGCDQLVDRFIE
ncbi:glutaredoxin [Tubulinosema ratisbonensis]|uniref:Glutaredoxin n=1 Tax=Tubulinosema ratisbonensis TaxID=291195 RepID=A0A437AHU1_9MICR|nr:glutaredoxin [Tubulinosema ratisbonensis]